ncbi:hypothetical protein BZG02_08100 [Labilibaculum filiforme]|uniref:Uncharacterized protein n=1 Tax=Labilibaculum filiforme TaxID=1940526 RepID=A0A2N3I0Y6_9BACT|nr:hypothetical protein [Labilibaculum filiforme]PKQ63964.1 hypothetical protein BZG02_08100 [Labilibaculum filiforme]
MNKNDIILGKGILNIQFGMLRAEVEKILGNPDDVKEYSLAPNEGSVSLFYHEKGLSFTFESIDQYKLSYISVLDSRYSIFQFIKLGLSKSMLLDELEHFQLGEYEFEDVYSEEFPTHELIFFRNKNLHLWIDNCVISEIQFGPYWEDIKTIVWENE